MYVCVYVHCRYTYIYIYIYIFIYIVKVVLTSVLSFYPATDDIELVNDKSIIYYDITEKKNLSRSFCCFSFLFIF